MSPLSITRSEEPEAARSPLWPVAVAAVAGLVLNLVAVPIPWSGGAWLRFGCVAGLVVACLRGPWWGLAVAAVAAAPLYQTPGVLVAEIGGAGIAGLAVLRGRFVTPAVVLYSLSVGLAFQTAWAS